VSYIGATIAPITVALAVASNVTLTALVRRFTSRTALGFLPVAVWLLSVIGLSTGRPEGDVLIPGGGAQGYVGLGLLLAGAVSGVGAGVVLTSRSATGSRARTGSGSRGGANTPDR